MRVETPIFGPSFTWPAPAPRYLRDELPPAPALPLEEVFGSRWAAWLTSAAEAKSAPPDYVLAALLAAAGAAIGNTRWATPWQGWAEPPILWTMAIGSPSSNKSPGLDAILTPLKYIERHQRQDADAELCAWREKAELAKIVDGAWKEDAKRALKDGAEPPARPDAANPGSEPFLPRLTIADSTVERLAVIVSKQPRGTLMARDELAGWLMGMTRYAGGGSDRPFWLEAYGGRGYTVERMGREPVHIDRLSIGVLGGIQPDRLRTLLMKSDDDGLLARFLPFWPNPAPIRRPNGIPDDGFLERALSRMHALGMALDDMEEPRPLLVPFSEDARSLLDGFRHAIREWESDAEGLLLSFIGKMPGLAVRLSLQIAYLDWAIGGGMEPQEITLAHFGRAAHFLEAYGLPMARRAYADAALSKSERAARHLVDVIREHQWERFSSRDVLRLDRAGLTCAADLNPALTALEEADILLPLRPSSNPGGGRPARLFAVNPAILGRRP